MEMLEFERIFRRPGDLTEMELSNPGKRRLSAQRVRNLDGPADNGHLQSIAVPIGSRNKQRSQKNDPDQSDCLTEQIQRFEEELAGSHIEEIKREVSSESEEKEGGDAEENSRMQVEESKVLEQA